MKNLRLALDIREFKACNKCPLKDTCSFKDQVPEAQKANLTDLIVALIGFAEKDPVTFKKMAESMEKTGKNEKKTEEMKDNTEKKEEKVEETAKNEENMNPEEKKEEKQAKTEEKDLKQQEKSEELNEENPEEPHKSTIDFKFKFWNSGLKVLDSLSVVLDDLYQNNGLESRRFINVFLEELSKSKQAQKVAQTDHFKYKQGQEKNEKKASSDSESVSEKEAKEEKEDGSESESDVPEPMKGQQKGHWNKRDDRFPTGRNQRNDRFSKGQEERFDRNKGGFDRNRERPDRPDRRERSDFGGNRERSGGFNEGRDRFNRPDRFGGENKFDGNRRNQSWGNDRRSQPWKNRDDDNSYRNKRNWDDKGPRQPYNKGPPRQRYNVEDEGFKEGNQKRFDRSEKFHQPEEIQNDEKFMKNSQREFKKYDNKDEKMSFRKRPQKEEFPVVEKEDMLMRKKTNRRENKGANFEFTETDKKKNE